MKNALTVDVKHPALYPDIAEMLRTLPVGSLFHSHYRFRHPAAIYQLSLQQIAMDLDRVLKACAAIRSGQANDSGLAEEVAQYQRILIYSLREHLDDCQMILMCFVDPSTVGTNAKAPDEILKSAGLVERQLFWTGVQRYADSYLMPTVNALKHSQGRFRTVTFECSPHDIRPGFYLEEMDENEVAQPSPKLHPGNTASSFARDVRSNLALVFRAAISLHSAIQAILGRLSLSCAVAANRLAPGIWTEVCKQVAYLDDGVFPQEVTLPFVRFSFHPQGHLVVREYGRDKQLSFPKSPCQIRTRTLGDGITRNFRMPYLGERTKP